MTALAWQINRFPVRRGAVRPWLLVAASKGPTREQDATGPEEQPAPSGAAPVPGPREPSDGPDSDDDREARDDRDKPGDPDDGEATTVVGVDRAGAPAAGESAAGESAEATRRITAPAPGPPPGPPPTRDRPTTPYSFPPGPPGPPPPGQFGGPPPQQGFPPPARYGPPPGQQFGFPPPGQYGGPPPPGQFGYPPPGQPYGGPPPAPKRRRRTVIALVVAAVLLVGAAGAAFVVHDRSARSVALLAADAPGTDPFTPTLVQGGPLVPTTPLETAGNRTPVGDLDGLFLDSTGSSACDRAPLESALDDPALAAAWAAPLGVAAPAVSTYVTGLTPVRLRADTRLTAHRNSGGQARPYAATLQAGTAVLVDDRGRPRVRCADGAPLTDAQPVDDPVYGAGWAGFDPTTVIEIRPAEAGIAEFGLVDAAGEQPFRRPAGTTGDQDVVARPDTGRLSGSYFLNGTQTRCEGLVDCSRAGALTLISRFDGCPAACAVTDPEIGDDVPLTRDGAAWRVSGQVPTQYRAGRCDGREVPYSFTTTYTVTDSGLVNGVWTATRVRADHEVRADQSAACVSVVINWTATGSGGGS